MSSEDRRLVSLSFTARAYAKLLADLADEGDQIFTGGAPLVEFIARRNGATRGDRRLMEREFAELFRVGYLSDRGDHVQVVHPTRRERIEPTTNRQRPRNDASTNEPRRGNDSATKNDLTPRNDSTEPHGGARVPEQNKKGEGEARGPARETPPPPVEAAQTPEVRCSTIEFEGAEDRARENHALLAALRAGGQGAVRIEAPTGPTLRFLAACREAGYGPETLKTLGEWLLAERDAKRGAFPWTHGRRSVDLPFLNHEEGARLTEFAGKALDWQASRPQKPAPPPPSGPRAAKPERPFVAATPQSLDAARRKAGLPSLLHETPAAPEEIARVA